MAGTQIVAWQHVLAQDWSSLRFGEVHVDTADGQHCFKVQVYFGELDPNAVREASYILWQR